MKKVYEKMDGKEKIDSEFLFLLSLSDKQGDFQLNCKVANSKLTK